jgi:hypothetical protein
MTREERLAQALRDNLKRRKAAARDLVRQDPAGDAPLAEDRPMPSGDPGR